MKWTTLILKTGSWNVNGKAPLVTGFCLLACGLGLGFFTFGAEKNNEIVAPSAGLPIGMIVPFAGPTNHIPEREGWLLCDGRELSVNEYAPLFACLEYTWGKGDQADTFRIPDLRGRFLRGVDHTAASEIRDPDREHRLPASAGGSAGNEVGSVQDDAFKQHRHLVHGSAWAIGNGGPGTAQLLRFHAAKSPDANAPEYDNDLPVLATGGLETRPKNANVNWLIKVK
jgi:microcystin-dependent protein